MPDGLRRRWPARSVSLSPARGSMPKGGSMIRGSAAARRRAAPRLENELEHRPREAGAGRHPEMHFIAAHRRAGRNITARGLGEPLAAAEHRLDIEQPEPGHLARRSLDPVRIGDMASQHLIAAANAEDLPALPAMRR